LKEELNKNRESLKQTNSYISDKKLIIIINRELKKLNSPQINDP
jgi:hypothetical protein